MIHLGAALIAGLVLGGEAMAADASKVRLHLEPSSQQAVLGTQIGIEALADIERGWHIQAHKPTEKFLVPTDLEFALPPGVTSEAIRYPPPDTATFSFAPGKALLVYEGKLGMATALNVPAEFAEKQARIEARLRYQACNDETCLPPMTATASLVVPVVLAAVIGDQAPRPSLQPLGGGGRADVGRWIELYGYVVTFLLVALLGVGLNLTPCVYPLVSVTISFFGGESHGEPRRVVWLAILYVLGIAVTFSVLGVMAALSGGLFGAALQRPVVLIGIATLMVVLALSMFGIYELRVPQALMRVAGGASGGMLGALFMGLTMGIVAAPCVGPIVLGLLVYVGSRQDAMLGLALFLSLALGLGAPYVVLAVTAGSLRKLPRSGEWLMWTERLFGFVLVGLAVYFVEPLIPAPLNTAAVPAVIAAAGIYLGFVDGSGANLSYFKPVKRVAGLVVLALAVWVGWPQPVESAIRWEPYSDAAFAAARAAGKPIVIDFAADWCLPCKQMDRTTFVDPKVGAESEQFQMIKVDLTEEGDASERITARFDVRGVPTTIFFTAAGRESERKVGYITRSEMLAAMRCARAGGVMANGG